MDLLIHVGLHKTGTTSVQNQLYRHRECLLAEGILYPTSGLFGSQHALIPGSVIPKHFFLDRVQRSLCTNDYLKALSEEVAHTNPSLVILSSEVFSEITHNRLACLGILNELKLGFQSCNLLLTIRKPQDLALSALKHSVRERIEPWIQDPLGSYIKAFNSVRSLQVFWETSGFPVHVKSIDDITSVNLTDHYFGDIINNYSQRGRSCLAPSGSEQEKTSKQKLNSDNLEASTYAILFLIGNSDKSYQLVRRPIFSLISKLVGANRNYKSTLGSISTKHLIGYLEHFRLRAGSNGDNQTGLVCIEDKLNAFRLAEVPHNTIQALAAIATEMVSSL
jgi:hypothetical protein